ncbi:MAG TPA: 4Fe-4S dicluster domain-containing protein [Anaerolineales bacterium]
MNCFVIADSRRCIGCYACQAACVENHRRVGLQAYPRLIVSYTAEGTMPVQCRQCEQAPCATVCPVKALVVRANTVQLNEGLCIGCKMCGLACPFGVILPAGTPIPAHGFNAGQYSYVNTPYQSEPMHLREMDPQNVLSLLAWNIGQKKVAVKCDLCYFDEQGPACVRACPHKALRLVDANDPKEAARVQQMKASPRVREELPSEAVFARQGDD